MVMLLMVSVACFAQDGGDVEATPVWLSILNGVLLVVSIVAGTFWAKAKGKAGAAFKLLAECLDALKDNQITTAEVKRIEAAYKELTK